MKTQFFFWGFMTYGAEGFLLRSLDGYGTVGTGLGAGTGAGTVRKILPANSEGCWLCLFVIFCHFFVAFLSFSTFWHCSFSCRFPNKDQASREGGNPGLG